MRTYPVKHRQMVQRYWLLNLRGEAMYFGGWMMIKENWFVLLVRTASEERVLEKLKEYLTDTCYTPFIPKKEWPHVKGNNVNKEIKICFPGYVFVKTQASVEDFLQDVQPVIEKIKEAYYFLYYGDDKRDVALREKERNGIDRLMTDDFLMDSSRGFMEGDRVKIVSGALMGMENVITKINERKRTAIIGMDILGTNRPTTLMLEVLEKSEEGSQCLGENSKQKWG